MLALETFARQLGFTPAEVKAAQAAVHNGACYLDREYRDWEGNVSPFDHKGPEDFFCVSSKEFCPLTLAAGSFWGAKLFDPLRGDDPPQEPQDAWEKVVELARSYGFWPARTPGEEDDYEDPGNAVLLQAIWRELIHERRIARAAANLIIAD